MTHKKIWFAGIFLSLIAHVGAARSSQLLIVVKLPNCVPDKVSIVIDGVDLPLLLDYDKDKKHDKYNKYWYVRLDDYPNEAPPMASLRLGGHRTFCRKAVWDKVGNEDAAIFNFECDAIETTNIKVEALKRDSKGVTYRYVRTLDVVNPPSSPADLRCVEQPAIKPNGPARIEDVRDDEKLELYFGKMMTAFSVNLTALPLHQTASQVLQELKRNKTPPGLPVEEIGLKQKYLEESGLHHVDIQVVK